ncbi:MAG: biopolymer transporter ExbD [Verrucomicrobiaceae bacterium]|nr:biopolymer transporter ExbD [Verrucomicrobiaceae bacterium]
MKLESTLPRQSPWIFAAPLMNALMLLIVCYMLNKGFLANSGLRLVDPAQSTSLLTGFDRAHIITIPAGDEAAIYFDGQPVTLDTLGEKLRQHRDGERRAIIHHDRMAPGGRLVAVTNIAHQQGYALALATVSPQQ